VEVWRAAGQERAVVIIPLLFETDATPFFDATICTACLPATQRRRLAEREWDEEQVAGRLAAQWPQDQKMERARYVIWTEGSLSVHSEQLRLIIS
jgi:dephospho-CoA kinase